MVGRDIGTVVVPDAGLKIFLRASEHERAKRRHDEQRAKGGGLSLEEVLADLRRRDAIDASREASPLRRAKDAVSIETDGLDIHEVVAEIIRHVEAASLAGPPAHPRSGI
jgi:cytidylate kinase